MNATPTSAAATPITWRRVSAWPRNIHARPIATAGYIEPDTTTGASGPRWPPYTTAATPLAPVTPASRLQRVDDAAGERALPGDDPGPESEHEGGEPLRDDRPGAGLLGSRDGREVHHREEQTGDQPEPDANARWCRAGLPRRQEQRTDTDHHTGPAERTRDLAPDSARTGRGRRSTPPTRSAPRSRCSTTSTPATVLSVRSPGRRPTPLPARCRATKAGRAAVSRSPPPASRRGTPRWWSAAPSCARPNVRRGSRTRRSTTRRADRAEPAQDQRTLGSIHLLGLAGAGPQATPKASATVTARCAIARWAGLISPASTESSRNRNSDS